MYIVAVTVHVLADRVGDFIAATRANADNTRKEPHNLRFDVVQVLDEPTQFMLYEVYDSVDGFSSHQKTAHYLAWKEKVAPWMAKPRTSIKCREIYPTERSGW